MGLKLFFQVLNSILFNLKLNTSNWFITIIKFLKREKKKNDGAVFKLILLFLELILFELIIVIFRELCNESVFIFSSQSGFSDLFLKVESNCKDDSLDNKLIQINFYYFCNFRVKSYLKFRFVSNQYPLNKYRKKIILLNDCKMLVFHRNRDNLYIIWKRK